MTEIWLLKECRRPRTAKPFSGSQAGVFKQLLILLVFLLAAGCGEEVVRSGGTDLVETVEHSVFPDAGLERAVRAALDRPRGDLADESLLGLQSLDAAQQGIVDLEGIERLAHLRQLVLGANQIRAIAALSPLSGLQFLDLSDNRIADTASLAALGNLRALDLSGNQVQEISPLSALRRLTHLKIDDNAVEDISPLAGLRLLLLFDAENNRIRDISPLFGLRLLRTVELSGNPLENKDDLKRLESRGVSVNFFVPFTSPFDPVLEEAIRRELGGHKGLLTDAIIASITSFSFAGEIKSLDGIERLVNLESLTIRFAGTDELAVLRDLTPLADLQKLTMLIVRDSQVRDLAPLAGLTRLVELHLPNNQIEDLTPLAGLTRLEYLNIARNPVVDLSPLRTLHQMATLNMTDNQVRDLAPLLELPALKSVWARGNPLSEKARTEQVQALRDRGVFVVGL